MPHPGQFCILKKELSLPGYRALPLLNGWILSSHERLAVFYLPKHQLLLLGTAWQTLPGKPTPEQELSALSERMEGPIADEELMALEESWCGRYVLLSAQRVFLDACGLLPVFHSPAGIASDLMLLAEAAGLPARIYTPGKVMNWMPGPMTHYPEIMRVMPGQIYCMDSGMTLPRPLLARSCPSAADTEERTRIFSELFAGSLRNMQAKYSGRMLLLALTGGYDSRTLYALAEHAGLDFDAFTLEYDGIFTDDVTIPRELCRLTGRTHHFIPRDHSRYAPALEEEYLYQTAGLIRDADRLSYAHGQYQELAAMFDGAVLMRGSIWETAVEFYGRFFTPDGPKEDFYDWFCVPENSPEKQSLEAYFDWCRRYPQSGLSACDAFYWEQRAGCWLSPIESGFELLDNAVSVQPANCRLLISMLLGFPREERITKAHQVRVIRYACPAVLDLPFGGSSTVNETAFTVLAHKLRRLRDRIEARGLLRTLSLYGRMLKKKL